MRTLQRTIVSALIYSKDNKLLMGKKDPKKGGVYSDCWHIPGGGVNEDEDEDEDKIAALKREVLEEVGIDISKYKIEFVKDTDKGITEKTLATGEKVLVEMQFNVYKIVIDDKNSSEITTTLSDDLIMINWFPIDQLSTVKLTPPSTKYFKEIGYIQ